MKKVSILFLMLFVAYLVTPSAIALIGDEANFSYVLSATEEEQSPEERNLSEKNTKILNKPHNYSVLPVNTIENNMTIHYMKNWSSVYFDVFYPPPEHLLS